MKTIRQSAYFRQRVLKEIGKGKRVTETAIKYRISRTSIYRWQKRYDGKVESLYERSHRPHSLSKPAHSRRAEAIKRVWSPQQRLGACVSAYGLGRQTRVCPKCLFAEQSNEKLGNRQKEAAKEKARASAV